MADIYIDEISAKVMNVYLPPMIHGCYIAEVAKAIEALPSVTETDWLGQPHRTVITVYGDDFYEHSAGVVYDEALRVWEEKDLARFIYKKE